MRFKIHGEVFHKLSSFFQLMKIIWIVYCAQKSIKASVQVVQKSGRNFILLSVRALKLKKAPIRLIWNFNPD